MSIQDCVHDALNALRDIVTDETVDVELRISAAEKILDYAASLGEYQDNKTDAIGFTVGDHAEQDFGEYFRKIRKAAGFKTQKQLAQASGVSQATISRIEEGTQKPQIGTLTILADYLGVSNSLLIDKAGYLLSDSA